MSNLSLRVKLLLIALVPILLLIVIGLVGIITSNNVSVSFAQVAEEKLPLVLLVEEIKFTGSSLITATYGLLLDDSLAQNEEAAESGESEEREHFEESNHDLSTLLENYRLMVTEDPQSESDVHENVQNAARALINAANLLITAQETNEPNAEVFELREEFEEVETDFLMATDVVVEQVRGELVESDAAVGTSVNAFISLTVALALASVALVSIIGYLIYRSITHPLAILQTAASRLRAGDLKQRAPISSADEIGQLADAFNSMAGSIEQRVIEVEAARVRAERSDQVKSAFLASMSHELRTPLNSVINFTQYVVDGDVGAINEQQEELLEEVVGSGKHLLNLINDVLDMSKIEAGSLNLFVEENVSIDALLNKMITTARGLLDGKPVRIQTAIEDDLSPIVADRQRILQILLNIMSNAVKFTEEGEITVSAKQSNGEILIAIQDTGVGIAPEDQSLVFEAFKQTDAGLRQAAGTGLGMPIAKSLAEAHGGRLWFESVANKGSTFYVVLPVKAPQLVAAMV